MSRSASVMRIISGSAIVCAAGVAGGCVGSWRPAMRGVNAAPVLVTVDLRGRLAPPGSRYTYRRTRGRGAGEKLADYVVEFSASGRSEGALRGCGEVSLADYLLPGGPEPEETRFPWPAPQSRTAAAFFLRFEPSLVYCPRALTGEIALRCQSVMRVYGAKGRHIYNGKANRSIALEGYETIEIDGHRYADCVRLLIKTRVRVPWLVGLDISEYLWLAPRVGEVKWVRRWRGFILWQYVDEMMTYELVKDEQRSSGAGVKTSVADRGERWSRCAVFLDPALPKPRLEGLRVETSTGGEGGATPPP